MRPEELSGLVVPSLIWPLLVTGLGTIAAVGTGALLVQGRRVPPVASVAAVGLPVLIVGGLASRALDAGADPEAIRDGVALAVGQRALLPLLVGAPAGFVLLLGAGAGARHGPRRVWAAIAGGVLTAAVVGLAAWGGSVIEEPVFTTFRAVIYAFTGAFAAAALLAGGPDEGPGADASGQVGVCWALIVAVGEVSGRAMAEAQALIGLATQPEAQRLEVARVYLDTAVHPYEPFAWAMYGVGALVALLGVSASARSGGTRLAGSAGALVWLALGAALLASGQPTAEQLVIAASYGAEADAPAVTAP